MKIETKTAAVAQAYAMARARRTTVHIISNFPHGYIVASDAIVQLSIEQGLMDEMEFARDHIMSIVGDPEAPSIFDREVG